MTSAREVQRGTLVSTLNLAGDTTDRPSDHVAFFVASEMPCDEHGSRLTKVIHDEIPRSLAPGIDIVCGFSSKPPDPDPDYFEKMQRYAEIISGPAIRIDPGATPRTFKVIESGEADPIFLYADSASGRAGIGDIASRLRGHRIGIVGLGGTGAHVLDHVAKTPVEIDLFDGDVFSQHNAFRSPGAASVETLQERLAKVEYFARTYAAMRRGIRTHAEYIDDHNVDRLSQLDFVFVCVDHGPSKRVVVEFLVKHDIPFVDVGMALWRNDGSVGGQVRTTYWSTEHTDGLDDLSFAAEARDDVYTANIQISELNALNAAHAVIRWKQHCEIYADFAPNTTSVYAIDSSSLISRNEAE